MLDSEELRDMADLLDDGENRLYGDIPESDYFPLAPDEEAEYQMAMLKEELEREELENLEEEARENLLGCYTEEDLL